MKLSKISFLISIITAQIELTRPDETTAIISATPGCYCIQPPIQIITNSDDFSFEFYNNWSCSGEPIDEAEGDIEFFKPVQAYSVKVIKNEDEESKYMWYKEDISTGKCKNSIEIGKVDKIFDFEEEYYEGDLDNSNYEPHKNYALASAPNNGFGMWNMNSYTTSKHITKNAAQALYFDDDDAESSDFGDDYPEVL